MLIAGLLALFPILFLFAPRIALAVLALAILLLYQKRVTADRKRSARPETARHRPVAWKDPWSTDGLGR